MRSRTRWIVVAILIVAGVYFLIFHKDPLPANHEAIGLGQFHLLHDVIGIALLAAAGYLVYVGRKKASPAPVPTP